MIEAGRRTAIVKTSLGEGELALLAMNGQEMLGRPFEYEVSLISENSNIGLAKLLGHPMTVELELPDQAPREFSGIVTHFSFSGGVGRFASYRAVLRPWVWLMSQTVRSRVYQGTTVPAVIEKLFGEHHFSDYVGLPPDGYRKFEYLVQYRESDFDFISRMMELEGIYYYFKHQGGKHTLVLADSFSAHEATPGYANIPFYPPRPGERRDRDYIDQWQVRRAIRSGKTLLRDFNFTRAGQEPIDGKLGIPAGGEGSDYEVYDYPGKFADGPEAEAQVRVRLEEQQADVEMAQGEGNSRGLGCGALFKLTQYPREDQNKQYLVVSASYAIRVSDYESLEKVDDGVDYRVTFAAMDSTRPYRLPRLTPKPVVQGPQTATVVGPSGQEIWTDKYGRVRLQFHWDREGKSDEDSACWVRVSQVWAGSQWGAIHIPRIGQEVIVDFLEGDPDRPIVTGRVYNADNMPPYELPTNQTQSGIKSRSTKGGTPDNFNEIRFEDKKGAEELHIQAEKNMTTLVKNDQSTTIKANRSTSITGNDSLSVQGNSQVTIKGNLSVSVKGEGKDPIKSSMDVTGKHDMKASDTIDMAAPTHIQLKVGGSSIMITPSSITITAGGGSVSIAGAVTATAKQGGKVAISPDISVESKNGGSLKVDANVFAKSSGGQQMLVDANVAKLVAGGSKVEADKSAVTVSSPKVSVTGGGAKLELQATAKVSGKMVTVAGDTMTEITGKPVKIN